MIKSNLRICLILICVNKFYQDLGVKFIQNNTEDFNQIIVFTDDVKSMRYNLGDKKSANKLVFFQIEGSKWPFPSLKRFDYFVDKRVKIESDIIVYCDVDLAQIKFLDKKRLNNLIRHNQMLFAVHPGYIFAALSYLLARKIPFELNPISNAFVKNSLFKKYIYGAVFMGPSKLFMEMATEISKNITSDLNRGIISIWHDESHLNYWRVKNKKKSKTSFGLVLNLPYFMNRLFFKLYTPNFICLDKGNDFERS
jgi:hypothetical protein